MASHSRLNQNFDEGDDLIELDMAEHYDGDERINRDEALLIDYDNDAPFEGIKDTMEEGKCAILASK